MRAISSMATRHLLADLLGAAADAGLPEVALESVGGVDAARRVAEGEAFDLVFLADDAVRRLAEAGHVDADAASPIALSQVAVAVPSMRDTPATAPQGAAFADGTGLRAALRRADRIGFSTGPSGSALVDLIEEWGLTDELSPHLVQARPGVPVAALLSEGEADLGLQQLSELVGQPGVRILGVLPPDCAIDTVFTGAVARSAVRPDDAADVLAFIRSPRTAAIVASHSFTPR